MGHKALSAIQSFLQQSLCLNRTCIEPVFFFSILVITLAVFFHSRSSCFLYQHPLDGITCVVLQQRKGLNIISYKRDLSILYSTVVISRMCISCCLLFLLRYSTLLLQRLSLFHAPFLTVLLWTPATPPQD